MSSRYPQGNNRQAGNKGFTKTQKVFVPKSQDQNQSPKSPIPNPTLSGSLRQSVAVTSSVASASRVRMGESGEYVSTKGNFVNYLPQDEAVAAGLGADEGGLDALESQRVVDLLNRELSRLLKLNPKEFWRQGTYNYNPTAFICFNSGVELWICRAGKLKRCLFITLNLVINC